MGKSGSRGSRGFGYRPGEKRGGPEQGGGPGSGERWFAPRVCVGGRGPGFSHRTVVVEERRGQIMPRFSAQVN